MFYIILNLDVNISCMATSVTGGMKEEEQKVSKKKQREKIRTQPESKEEILRRERQRWRQGVRKGKISK